MRFKRKKQTKEHQDPIVDYPQPVLFNPESEAVKRREVHVYKKSPTSHFSDKKRDQAELKSMDDSKSKISRLF